MGRGPKCDDQIVKAIEDHWFEHCLPPSTEYLVNNTCIASKNTMFFAIRRLAKQGYIKLVNGKAIPICVWYAIKRSLTEKE